MLKSPKLIVELGVAYYESGAKVQDDLRVYQLSFMGPSQQYTFFFF